MMRKKTPFTGAGLRWLLHGGVSAG